MAEINIHNELKELGCNELINVEKNNVFSYPEGYFDEFSENIVRNIWFQSFSTAMLYAVPGGYFENFPQLMLDKLSVQLGHSMPAHNTLYQLPDNYFNDLAGNILTKIKNEKFNDAKNELEEISPLLSKIPKLNVYTVPDGYFEKNVTIQQKKPAKVISIAAKSRKWFTYAAAACVAVLITLSGYFYFGNQFSGTNSIQKKIASINVEKAVSQLPDSTINSYLANDNSDAYVNQNTDEQDLNIQNLINNTSDQDIEDYLIQNPAVDEEPEGI